MTNRERYDIAISKSKGWRKELLVYMLTADLGTLRFRSLPDKVKAAHGKSEGMDAEIAALIAVAAMMRTEAPLTEEALEHATRLVVISLGVGHVGDAIGLDPRGGREITEALQESGVTT